VLTLFASSLLPKLESILNLSLFHLSIASKSLQTCLPLFHASSIIFAALGAHMSRPSSISFAPVHNSYSYSLCRKKMIIWCCRI